MLISQYDKPIGEWPADAWRQVLMSTATVIDDMTGEVLAHEWMTVNVTMAIHLIIRNPVYYGPLFSVHPMYRALKDTENTEYSLKEITQ